MSLTAVEHAQKPTFWTRARKLLAGGAVAALAAGTLVYAGLGAQQAAADTFEPTVTITPQQTLVLGEDLTVDITFGNELPYGEASNNRYNLSVGVVIPANVDVVEAPWPLSASFGPGQTVPGVSVNGDTCIDLGLEPVNPSQPAAGCRVPVGQQYLVFENFSDLPASATTQAAQLVLRPQVDNGAGGLNVGDSVDVRVNAYTSSDERFVPGFPGSSGRGGSAVTSASGNETSSSPVRALRITKTETVSPENELLRGVHGENGTIFELRIRHTGEGDLQNAEVVDYLPAGLEYLGSATLSDNTTAANGTDGVDEWIDETDPENPVASGPLNTSNVGAGARDESRVETIIMTDVIADQYLDSEGNRTLEVGAVYTRVTWNIGTWLQNNGGVEQAYPTSAGTAGETVIRYRAGIPLFENELFSEADEERLAERGQGANLDNNTGASTRHGTPDADDRPGKPASSLLNLAAAKGDWKGETSEDFGTETVDAVDVRVVKSVRTERPSSPEEGGWGSNAAFNHGNIADYRLSLATSEYVTAEVGERPNRLVDDLANGLCPIYPTDIVSKLTNGGIEPLFRLGDPNIPQGEEGASSVVSLEVFQEAVVDGAKLTECGWDVANFNDEAIFTGVTLTGLAFDPATGHFFQDLQLSPADALASPNAEHEVIYSARQNTRYLSTSGENGATSSLDTIQNTVEIEATTTARPGVNGLENGKNVSAGNQYWAHDDSAASVRGEASTVDKYVLRNDSELGVPGAADIWGLDYAGNPNVSQVADAWTKSESRPFAAGDEVWFKIHWEPASGADVRNPILEDFLPAGVKFDESQLANGEDENEWQASSNLRAFVTDGGQLMTGELSIGECSYDLSSADHIERAYRDFVGPVNYDDETKKLTWTLGSADCYTTGNPSVSPDRFWPGGLDLDMYIKVTVTDAQAFGEVDLSQNLAKYQQMNVDREIFFLRDQAELTPDMSARLVKGIQTNNHPAGSNVANGVNTNVDGEQVVQNNEVTFRLDVTAPAATTTGYEIWDALPEGIDASDIKPGSFSGAPWAGSTEGTAWSSPGNFEAHVYDWGDLPASVKDDVNDAYEGRTIVVWQIGANVPGSAPATGDAEGEQKGFTLSYTLTLPNESNGERAAQVSQEYKNTASIVQFDVVNNTGPGTTTTLVLTTVEEAGQPAQDRVPTGGASLTGSGAKPNQTAAPVSNRTPVGDEIGVFGANGTDPSDIYLPEPTMQKRLIATEVGPNTAPNPPAGENIIGTNNADGAIVQGEYATFEYSVTIPAHTTVIEAKISDRGDFRRSTTTVGYEVVESATKFFQGDNALAVSTDSSDETAFRGTPKGELRLPDLYHNSTNEPQVFSVQITVWVKDRNGTDLNGLFEHTPQLSHGNNLVNLATLEYTNVNTNEPDRSKTGTATVQYIEPDPAITKTASKTTGVVIDDVITYTLTARNGTNLPTSFDTVVYDCVPEGIINITPGIPSQGAVETLGSCAIVDGKISAGTGTGTLITWNVGDLNSGAGQTLQYTAQVSPAAGGSATYRNNAEIIGYTLPGTGSALGDTTARHGDRVAAADHTITMAPATISKAVNKPTAPVGDELDYTITVNLPANLNFYNVSLTDTLPAGLSYIPNSAVVTESHSSIPTITDEPSASGQTLTWIAQTASTDILSHTETRSITITLKATITPGIGQSTTSVTNSARFGWDSAETGGTRSNPQATAVTTILNPVLGVQKDVKFEGETNWRQRATGDPDQTLNYRIAVTNTGNTASFHNVIVDTLPEGVVNPTGFTVTVNGIAIASPNTAVVSGDGDTITWTLPGAIAASGGSVTLGYNAEFAPASDLASNATGVGTVQTNTARVTSFESFPRDSSAPSTPTGRTYTPSNVQDTAEAQPQFPYVELQKTVADTSRTAYVGEPFEWILTATNNGAGKAQKVILTDTLPENWEFTEVKSVTVAGAAVTSPLPQPADTTGPELVWTLGADAGAEGTPAAILLPGQSIEIRFTATPLDDEAIEAPGVGADNPHNNTLSAVTTDRTNATGNAGNRSHTGPDADDDAFLREANLLLVKEAIGGTTNEAFGLDDGSWVPGASVGANYTQPQWRITVTNQAGFDTGYGPFVFSDAMTLPAGVTVDPASLWNARYFATSSDTTGTPVTLNVTGGTGTTAAPYSFTVGDRNTALTAGAEGGRIVITANVSSIAVTASGTAENTASVGGRTYERDTNTPDNEDDASKPLSPLADLTITKQVNTSDAIVVGSPITWGIEVRNLGPSVSKSPGDNEITITDTVPAGVTGVTATGNADWAATLENGDAIPAEGVGAGTKIVWTYQHAEMPIGITAPVELSGTILTSHVGPLTNSATVVPKETPQPTPHERDTHEVTVTPSSTTSLAIAKTRVVYADGTWQNAGQDDPFVPGDPVSYRIDVTNNGPADARVVTVVDESPEPLSYETHDGISGALWDRVSGGTNAANTQNDGWDTFTLVDSAGDPVNQAPGATTSFVVSYTTLSSTGDVENWAEASAENSTNTPRDPDNSDSTRRPDVSIEKTRTSDAVATAGESVSYSLLVTSNGVSDASAPVTVVDALPAGFSYQADSAQVSINGATPSAFEPVSAGQNITWADLTGGADLPVGQKILITFTADIAPSVRAQAEVLNTAVVSAPGDTDPSNNSSTAPVEIKTDTIMEITKVVEDGPWVAGTDVSYTLTIRNDGPSAAPASVTDTLPTGLTMVSMSGGVNWDCSTVTSGAADGTCDFTANAGLHPVGESTITVTARIAANAAELEQPLENTAVLTWTDSESTKTDEDTEEITVTRAADLGLVKRVLSPADGDDTTSVVAGEHLWYSIVITNHGTSKAVGPIVVDDALPEGISFDGLIGGSVGNWVVEADSADPQQLTFTRGTDEAHPDMSGLAVGASLEIRFRANVSPSVAAGDELTNVATIDDATLTPNNDGNSENNADDATVTAERKSNVSVEKGHVAATPVDEYEIGKDVTFTLDVSNNGAGPSNASGIVITDTLPAGLQYERIAGTGWSLVGEPVVNPDGTTTVTASYAGEVAPGATAERLTITAKVTVAIGDNTEVTNTVCVTGLGTGQTNTNTDPCDTDEIVVVPLADLVLFKTVDPDSAESAGQPVTWNIAVGNDGPSDSLSTADNRITVTDTVPTGISGVADPSQGDWVALLNGEDWGSGDLAQAGDVITWEFQGERIPAGTAPSAADESNAFVVLSLTGIIDAGWIDGVAILNIATVTPGDTRDPVEPNNTDEIPVVPGDTTDVRVGKTRVVQVDGEWVVAAEQDPVPNFVPGAEISYRITVINDGPAHARDVVVVDETPAGLTYQSHESIGAGEWAYAAGGMSTEYPDGAPESRTFGTFSLGERQEVGVDHARTFVITYATDSAMQHDELNPLINEVEVTADNDTVFHPVQRDRDNANSTRSADLSIVKSHTAPAPDVAAVAGETVDYHLLVTNHGPSVSDAPILVTDTLPADFSYRAETAQISVNGEASRSVEPTVAGQGLTWTDITDGAELAVGDTVEITFAVLIDSGVAPIDGVLNAALVDGPNDNNIENDRSTDPIDITGVANLTIGKVAITPADEITAGEAVTWQLTPRNAGPSVSLSTDEQPITVIDTLPAGIERLVSDPSNEHWQATTSNTGGWSQAGAGDTITWTFTGERFAVGDEPNIEITAIIDAAWHDGEIANTATLTPGPTEDPELPNEDTSIIEPGDRTSLEIWKNRVVEVDGEWVPAASLDPVPAFAPGTDITYRIDVANTGPAVARDVQVVDPIPAGLSNPTITTLDGLGSWSAETLTCEGGLTDLAGYAADDCFVASLDGSLLVGLAEMRSFLVTFESDPALDPEADIVNWAQARATNVPEGERPNDNDSTTGVPGADLSIVKTVAQDRVLAGSTVGYELVVTNGGPSIARGPVTITDQLPIGLSYVAGTATVSIAGAEPVAIEPTIDTVSGSELLSWAPLGLDEALAVDATIVIELQTQLADGLYATDGLVNTARVAADDQYDYDPTNNESSAIVYVDPLVTLTVEKTAVGEFQVGQVGHYEIVVTNSGPTADPGPITVTDMLPNGLIFHSSPDGATVAGKNVTWVLPAGLDVDESVTLSLAVSVQQAAFPEVTNIVTIDSPSEKTPESKLVDDETVTVKPVDPLSYTGGASIGYLALIGALLMLGGAAASVAGSRRRKTSGRYAA